MGLRLGPFCWHQTAASTTAWSQEGITSPETQLSPAWGYDPTQAPALQGASHRWNCLSLPR